MMLFYVAIGLALAMVVTAGVCGGVAAHQVHLGSRESIVAPAAWVVSLVAVASLLAFGASAIAGAVAQFV